MVEQLDLFYYLDSKIHIDREIKLIELFSGYGSQLMALKRLEKEGYCKVSSHLAIEIDKYAINSYNTIHGTNYPPTDIKNVHGSDLNITNTDNYFYIVFYSFPCQSLSVAGKNEGMAKGSSTRSGLLWEVERILNECEKLPQMLMMENVCNVHGKKHVADFEQWKIFLESKGYKNFVADLNAKDYGIPQNRKRCFMISVLGDYQYKFPEPIPLEKTMKDFLEDKVDDKYYLSNSEVEYYLHDFSTDNEHNNEFRFKEKT